MIISTEACLFHCSGAEKNSRPNLDGGGRGREHVADLCQQLYQKLQQKVTGLTSVFGAKNGDFLTFLVLLSGITFELKLERTSFPHHLHSVHLENDYKPRLPCNNTRFSSKIVLEKHVKRKYADLILIFWVPKKGAVHLIPSQNAFF